MNDQRDDDLGARRGPIRLGLVILAVGQGIPAVWALFAPHSFWEEFPGAGRHWVAPLGPFDEHLVTDYGSAYLAITVLVALTAILLERRLVQIAMVVWIVQALPHFVFHLTELDELPGFDQVAQTLVLALNLLLPVAILWAASWRAPEREEATT
jgi:hypothetical protein